MRRRRHRQVRKRGKQQVGHSQQIFERLKGARRLSNAPFQGPGPYRPGGYGRFGKKIKKIIKCLLFLLAVCGFGKHCPQRPAFPAGLPSGVLSAHARTHQIMSQREIQDGCVGRISHRPSARKSILALSLQKRIIQQTDDIDFFIPFFAI